ncbi:MAG: hemerythrin domain-containing protein [Bryobacterales bacterium]|jgi:hemerythrin-like domain-containing protein|nr:hemerythrin domain-containing protein [Bryobacterales bacterium]
MNLLEAFLGEHAMIRGMLSCLVRQSHRDTPARLRPALALVEDALLCHAATEDQLLFDRLHTTRAGLSAALESMQREHEAIRGKLGALRRAPESEFRAGLERFAELVSDHFAVEERVLFPLVSEMVEPAALSHLAKQWAKQRGVDSGK